VACRGSRPTPPAVLRPAALRAGTALRETWCTWVHRKSLLRAPPTQGGQLGRPGCGRKSTRPGANASSNSPRLSSSTGCWIWSRRRGSTGIATTGCSPRITRSGPPSQRSLSATVESCAMPRPVGVRSADMRHAEMPPAPAATHATNRALTTPPGSQKAKLMAPAGEEFPVACPGCGGDIRLIALHPSRGRSGRSSSTSANRSHRRPSLPPVARRPTGESSCRPMTTGQSFRRRPTNCLRSISIASDGISCHGADGPREEWF